jgi:hypothetical protein
MALYYDLPGGACPRLFEPVNNLVAVSSDNLACPGVNDNIHALKGDRSQ